jgi:hypothetical protein
MKAILLIFIFLLTSNAYCQLAYAHNEYAGLPKPDPPELLKPIFGEQNILLRPEFLWSSVKGATSYNLQVSPDPVFLINIIDADKITTTYYRATPEQKFFPLLVYFWKVRSKNDSGYGNFSSTFDFMTGK